MPRSGNWHVDDTSSRQRRRSHRGRRVQGGSVVGRGIGGRVLTLKTVEYNTYTLHFSDTSGISKQKKVFAQSSTSCSDNSHWGMQLVEEFRYEGNIIS